MENVRTSAAKSSNIQKRAGRLSQRLEKALQESQSVNRNGLSKYALHVLRMQPALRSILDIESVHLELRKQAWVTELPDIVLRDETVFKVLLKEIEVQTLDVPEVSVHDAGDPLETFYVVLSGTLELRSENGKENDVLLKPGQVAGANFLDDNAVWPHSVWSDKNGTEVLALHKADYQRSTTPFLENQLNSLSFLGRQNFSAKLIM